ncbi:MAG TPA: WYL domain-containing protein [Lachnospiraceae bacterium]|nr:WYL domain-containing protein [Lachnospiraceae bacterium]
MTSIRNKQRPFRLLRFLHENTDENHPVSTSELVKIFQAEDAHASRKTVKDDIDVLVAEGMDIITIRSTQHSFFLASRLFEVPEIKFLIDAVSSSKFIPKEKSDQLIRKLTSLVSRPQAEKVRRHLYTADRVKADNRQSYYTVDAITDAINEGKKIRFQYLDYTASKEKILRHEGAAYLVSPYALVWDDNHYYMFGYSDGRQKIANYRVDRMVNTGMTEEEAVPRPENFCTEEYVQHQFRMFAGEEVDVVLECRNDMMRYIVDQFGEDVETWKSSEDTFYAKVNVADSPTFYGWVFPFEGKIRISAPDRIRDKYQAMVRAAEETEER